MISTVDGYELLGRFVDDLVTLDLESRLSTVERRADVVVSLLIDYRVLKPWYLHFAWDLSVSHDFIAVSLEDNVSFLVPDDRDQLVGDSMLFEAYFISDVEVALQHRVQPMAVLDLLGLLNLEDTDHEELEVVWIGKLKYLIQINPLLLVTLPQRDNWHELLREVEFVPEPQLTAFRRE